MDEKSSSLRLIPDCILHFYEDTCTAIASMRKHRWPTYSASRIEKAGTRIECGESIVLPQPYETSHFATGIFGCVALPVLSSSAIPLVSGRIGNHDERNAG